MMNEHSVKSILKEFSGVFGGNISMNYLKQMELDKPGMSTWHLKNIFTVLEVHNKQSLNSKDSFRPPVFDFIQQPSGEWKCKLTLFYPLVTTFEVTDSVKKRTEELACRRAVIFLRGKKAIDANLNPIFHGEEEKKSFEQKMYGPVNVHQIPLEIRDKMKSFIQKCEERGVNKFFEQIQHFPFDDEEICNHVCNDQNDAAETMAEFEDTRMSSSIMFDVVSGMPYKEVTPERNHLRSEHLAKFIQEIRPKMEANNTAFAGYRFKMKELPVSQRANLIVNIIETNRVTVISGQTGSGKTTQIPLLVFEDLIRKGRGAEASIVITQPRRLPAIAIADAVAYQFGEQKAGQSIGYHVRMDKCPPMHSRGGLLFCTTGILMRKLTSNPDLKGVSHVFVDEVHERDVICDFTLMLLKRLLERNKDVKVVLMSASINTKIFSSYFGNAPVLELEGRLYPVTNYYLPQVQELISDAGIATSERTMSLMNQNNPKVNRDLVVDVIRALDKTKPDGAILCFLPGWDDIRAVKDSLSYCSDNLRVVPVHSMLPHSDQKLIFSTPPSGMRKVVLATNIAETSLTVPDVVYVIDPGLCKEMRYDRLHHVTSFGLHWISRANTIQRQGRAGRIQAGECFKLFDKNTETAMDAFPTAEMLRIPLETVVMQAKLYCPQEKAETFLSTALEPPSKSALNAALRALKIYGILDENENLTILGKKVVHFTLHPSLSVALVSAAFMGVLEPALNVVSTLSAPREPFMLSMGEDRREIRHVKNKFANGRKSDHVAYAHTIERYEEQQQSGSFAQLREFEQTYRISHMTMKNIIEMKKISIGHLVDAKIIKDKNFLEENRRSASEFLLQGALLTGFYPNTVVVREGRLVNSKIKRGYTSLDVETGKPVRLIQESLLKDLSDSLLSTGFITYFSSFFSEEVRQLTLKDGSLISTMMFFLFVGQNMELQQEDCKDDRLVYQMDNQTFLKFGVSMNDVNLLLNWKDIFYKLAFWFIRKDNPQLKQLYIGSLEEDVVKCHRVFFSLTHQLLEAEDKLGF